MISTKDTKAQNDASSMVGITILRLMAFGNLLIANNIQLNFLKMN